MPSMHTSLESRPPTGRLRQHNNRKEAPVSWNQSIRQIHRWVSVVFTLAVIFNGVAVALGKYTGWMGAVAVLPLALLLFTGLYLFVLPYANKSRDARRTN